MNQTELISAGIDIDELLDRLMQNSGLIKIFVKKFLDDRNFDNLVDAIQKGDMKSAEGYCHTLKGMCGNMSLKELFTLFQTQLALFRDGSFEMAASMMSEITPIYKNAVSHMEMWLAQER